MKYNPNIHSAVVRNYREAYKIRYQEESTLSDEGGTSMTPRPSRWFVVLLYLSISFCVFILTLLLVEAGR